MSAESVAVPSPQNVPPARPVATTTLNVLLVEDDADLADMYALALRHRGYGFRLVANGLDVPLELALHRPDVIALDIELPGLNGMEVLRLLKLDPATAAIPVMMLTTWPREIGLPRAIQLGAADYAVKTETTPSQLAQLLEGLARRVGV